MRWAPAVFLPAPFHEREFRALLSGNQASAFPFADLRLRPHYPAQSPLDDVLRLVAPRADQYITEKYAFEIMPLLNDWAEALKKATPASDVLAKFVDASLEASTLATIQEIPLGSESVIEVFRRRFGSPGPSTRERFVDEIRKYLSPLSPVDTAEFEITGIQEIAGPTPEVQAEIRYTLAGTRSDGRREQRIGSWQTQWSRGPYPPSANWRIRRWEATEETVSRARAPIFIDITAQALGGTESYKGQLLRGADHWRTVLDGACGIDVYGNNGVAAGDIDNDGFDDIYVCQTAGLPNRLYHNRGDGTFEDVTGTAGVGVLDATACALFADFENKGLQDLLVVCASGPLLFLNQGNGKFLIKKDAFKFAQPPQGTFTHAAIADYDGDGRLDIYFCLYSYYVGLDQYRYPAPYFDARNGPPNFLLHNQGNAAFQDRTAESGLNADNDRYSFACAWGDHHSNGLPGLYVANDFGRSNLYRNTGNGTFASISTDAGVEDAGAGMSASWFDFDGDGNQDIFVANMWSAAGMRISEQEIFHQKEPEKIRELYRRHSRGNSLYRNIGNGKFENVSEKAGVDVGRWAWSSDSWDFDHDGHPDLYIANGYISAPGAPDVSSFFWRQVVGRSPQDATPSPHYEQGWNAINELVRSDSSWNGHERNVFYRNHGDGTFSDVSAVTGLDFSDDSRAFALADLDHDGRLEIILKNRNAPQLRILRNVMAEIGNSISFRLRGTKCNRDAIGTAVTVEARGSRQTKYLQAGSGFLSQHAKQLFFGVGRAEDGIRATIQWPGGAKQTFDNLPVNHRIEVEEGSDKYSVKPFSASRFSESQTRPPQALEPLPSSVETWLMEPLPAPEFALPDFSGKTWTLKSFRGSFLLLTFWAKASSSSIEQLRLLRKHEPKPSGPRILALNAGEPDAAAKVRSLSGGEKLPFPVVIGTAEVCGIYNIIYRYLFDRRRDLSIPTSFLLDEDGMIVKIYQGLVAAERVVEDVKTAPRDPSHRIERALPFAGKLYQGEFSRNDFTYGVAFFQRGYFDQATESFKQVIAARPDDPEAYYNLGTLYLRRNALEDARGYLEQTVKLRPNYPEAWNNLGMIAAQEGHADQAVEDFRQSLRLRPDYAVALVNLGNVYRRQKSFAEAGKLLARALEIQPSDPEVNYSLGMLYAQQEQIPRAEQYLEQAVNLRPGYGDALNNLGVLFVREQRYPEAKAKFEACIQAAPQFDQAYLNLARLYVILNEKDKAKEVLQSLLRQQRQHKMAQQALEMLN